MIQKYANCAIFAGLITTPINKNSKDFFKNEFKNKIGGLFSEYKKELLNTYDDAEWIEKETKRLVNLYKPRAYNIFGQMDMAILSLVDDFSFGSHAFRPNHIFKGLHNDIAFQYDYQILTGYIPIVSLPRTTLEDKWEFVINRSENRFPLIGITKIKINSSFLIGSGKKILILISDYISSLVNEYDNLEFFIFESFCNYELTLLSFSDSYRTITEFVNILRECDFHELSTSVNEQKQKKKLVDDILENSVLATWVDDAINDNESINLKPLDIINNSHIITSSFTTFGYDNFYLSNPDKYLQININDTSNFVINFDVKPGHLKSFLTMLHQRLKDNNCIFTPTGEGFVSAKFQIFNMLKLSCQTPMI